MTPLVIESSSAMDEFISTLANEKIIAVDTEFFRETTYYPKLALVQIASDTVVACIDPLAFDAKPALQKILCDEKIIKIFHSCSQDLEVLFYYLGAIPAPIYDTQIANALLTDHHQIGYAALVENELDIQLDKSQTRTNWLQRPLTTKQIEYAGDDVLYLYQLHHRLDDRLNQLNRGTWFEEESRKLLLDENGFQVDTKKLWKRVKGATKLNREKLAIVQAVAEWREKIAQQQDKTRRRALSDNTIIQLASNPPKDKEALDRYISDSYNINNESRQHLLEKINTARQSSEDTWPNNRFAVLDGEQKQLLKNLQTLINTKAAELGLSSAILCSRKDLEQLILLDTSKQDSTEILTQRKLNILQGWRLDCIGQQLIDSINVSMEKVT